MKASFFGLFLIAAFPLIAAEAVPVEKPLVMVPFVVVGRSAKETGLMISATIRTQPGGRRTIEEPVVRGVRPGSVAAEAGVTPGDRLVQIGDVKLAGLDATRWHEEYSRSHEGEVVVFGFRKPDSQTVRFMRFRFVSSRGVQQSDDPGNAQPPRQ